MGVRDLDKKIAYDAMDEKIAILAEEGIILVSGEIGDGSASVFFITTSFLQITRPNKPIWIVMNSTGGSVTECLAICDIIRALIKMGIPVNILGVGLIASGATLIMQMATRRYSFPHTQFLIHQASQSIIEEKEEVSQGEERIEEMKRVNKLVMGLISKRIGMPLDKLIKLAKKTDYWLDAEAAKKLGSNGLIDEIVDRYPFEL